MGAGGEQRTIAHCRRRLQPAPGSNDTRIGARHIDDHCVSYAAVKCINVPSRYKLSTYFEYDCISFFF